MASEQKTLAHLAVWKNSAPLSSHSSSPWSRSLGPSFSFRRRQESRFGSCLDAWCLAAAVRKTCPLAHMVGATRGSGWVGEVGG